MRVPYAVLAVAVVAVSLGPLSGCGTGPAEEPPTATPPAPDVPAAGPASSTWEDDLARYREERERRLRGEYGWLSLVGLDWLEPGANRVGADPEATVRLPLAVSPAHVATLHLDEDGTVRLEPVSGAPLLVDGREARPMTVATDVDPEPTEFQVGDLRFHVIRRADRVGVRSRWPRATTREEFDGLTWYPPDPGFRVTGRLVREEDDGLVEVDVPNALGHSETSLSPGRVVFELDGARRSLMPTVDGPDDRSLFFVFRDGTSGRTTYPAGRFLYADLAEDDTVVLDFNRAYSPPCAFTPYATCPLPPPGNALEIAITAGERHDGHGSAGHAEPEVSGSGSGRRRANESSTS